ncbi:PKD domain-containing protein, partial [Planctomycetota bacterium]
GEACTFTLNNGLDRTIRLRSVKEYRDSVIKRVRRAEVDVDIDGKIVRLKCAPYVMPTEVDGLRIQADTTSGWGNVEKDVQFSLWDAKDPIVNTVRFKFPISDYLLFSHGIQTFNEVTHLGLNNSNPQGVNFYHDFGIDLGGFLGREQIVSCTEGEVLDFWFHKGELCSVLVQDKGGLLWEYAHLDSVFPNIGKGMIIKRGQAIGMLGVSGPSGAHPHLHLGTCLSKSDFDKDKWNHWLNLYPWLIEAYLKQFPLQRIYAIARPHHTVAVGEQTHFDGSNSLAHGTKIILYQWEFSDGVIINQAQVRREFDTPGTHSAILRIKDEQGQEDLDVCMVKVFPNPVPAKGAIPTIFLAHYPTLGLKVDDTVHFQAWIQEADNDTTISMDFGDGSVINDYVQRSEFQHIFKIEGIYIVTAKAIIRDMRIEQKIKVVVDNKPNKTVSNIVQGVYN